MRAVWCTSHGPIATLRVPLPPRADRRADLWLDGVLTASDVPFASSVTTGEEIHLFSFDPGTVWWDDIAIRL